MEKYMCKIVRTEGDPVELVGYSEMGMAKDFFMFSWANGDTAMISTEGVTELRSYRMNKPELLNG